MANATDNSTAAPSSSSPGIASSSSGPVGQTLLEKVGMPLMFLAAGWALGFFHGRSSKKSAV